MKPQSATHQHLAAPSPVQAHSCACPRASRFERCEVKHNPNPTPDDSPFGSVFLLLLYFGWCRPGRHCSVVVGDIAVSSWATLQCRSGRHCSVVVGDIALELCTGQKKPNIPLTAVSGSGQRPVSLRPRVMHRPKNQPQMGKRENEGKKEKKQKKERKEKRKVVAYWH